MKIDDDVYTEPVMMAPSLFFEQESSQNILSMLSGSFPSPKPMSLLIPKKVENTVAPFDDSELLALLSGTFGTAIPSAEKSRLSQVEEEDVNEDSNSETSDHNSPPINPQSFFKTTAPAPLRVPEPRSKFIDREAEVEEDEFMNYGGIDGENLGAVDEYEPDMLAEVDKSKINAKAIQELHR